MSRRRKYVWLLLSLGFIAVNTLRPVQPTRELPFWCLGCSGGGTLDVLLNIMLFLPLGAALSALGRPWLTTLASGAALSFLIELLQGVSIAGRHASAGDFLANSLGALFGALLFSHWGALVRPRPTWSLRMAAGWTGICVGVLAITSVLLRPAAHSADFWGQWAAQSNGEFEPWRGQVHRFTVNGIDAPYNFIRETRETRERFAGGTVDARIEVTTGSAPVRLSAIARLVNDTEEVVLLGQQGTDLIVRARLNARDARVWLPYVRLPGALPIAGETVSIGGGTTRRGWFLSVLRGTDSLSRTIPFSAGLGWALLQPLDRTLPPHPEVLSALWLAALALPIGLWASAAGGSRWWVSCLTVAVLLALWTVNSSAGYDAPSLWEFAGIIAGAGAGTLLQGALSRSTAVPSD